MKRQFLKVSGIGFIAFCLVFTLMGRATWAATDGTGDDVSRKQQEYIKRIVTNPSGTWIEYMQRTSWADLLLTGTIYPEISYRIQIPNIMPNWWAPSTEYTEYSPIGGMGGMHIIPGLWDLLGSGGGGIWSGVGSPWWGTGTTGGIWPQSSQWGNWNPGGSFWPAGGWTGGWQGGWNAYDYPSSFLY